MLHLLAPSVAHVLFAGAYTYRVLHVAASHSCDAAGSSIQGPLPPAVGSGVHGPLPPAVDVLWFGDTMQTAFGARTVVHACINAFINVFIDASRIVWLNRADFNLGNKQVLCFALSMCLPVII
ncbi:hypothetical protein OE88DRAFT_1656338 [Heliocybe sulcata]|uniref:Uncharacterized protein n=1 Tax=Heliocybe sulcata TaxID=5364 RepID=A0A5C3N8F6_9AGAM|nr:hypothetical protein OE88DRAFT_1656338 [Heliocybe sulcata]